MLATIDDIVCSLSGKYIKSEAEELAYWLIEEQTGLSRWEISLKKEGIDIPDLESLLARLRAGEPIQYVFGHVNWMGLDLNVTKDTLIPRPETAELVEKVMQYVFAKPHPTILDIGTGTGCIAIALKKRHSEWDIYAMDLSEKALAVAKENAAKNKVSVHWIKGDIFFDEIGEYDLIVSNPPYIAEHEKKEMEENVLKYEPAMALFVPDEDPLRFYRRIASLKKAPCVAFEISQYQSKAMYTLMQELGYTDIQIYKDSYGNERILTARIDC